MNVNEKHCTVQVPLQVYKYSICSQSSMAKKKFNQTKINKTVWEPRKKCNVNKCDTVMMNQYLCVYVSEIGRTHDSEISLYNQPLKDKAASHWNGI